MHAQNMIFFFKKESMPVTSEKKDRIPALLIVESVGISRATIINYFFIILFLIIALGL